MFGKRIKRALDSANRAAVHANQTLSGADLMIAVWKGVAEEIRDGVRVNAKLVIDKDKARTAIAQMVLPSSQSGGDLIELPITLQLQILLEEEEEEK